MGYEKILVAVDLGTDSAAVLARAMTLAPMGSEIHVAHVLEPLIVEGGYDLLPPLTMDTDSERRRLAQDGLRGLANSWAIPAQRCHLAVGATKGEILRLGQELSADLIVVGSHGRHGLALLLGSTANAVLHGAPCDVLAVRVAEPVR